MAGNLQPHKTGISKAGFLRQLKDRKIVQTIAAFIAGGWLTYEIVHWVLVVHFHFPEGILDIALVTLLGALFSAVIWLWFGGAQERPGRVRVEVLFVPLIILLTLAIDVNLTLKIFGIYAASAISLAALGLGVAWIVFKSLQWAARVPDKGREEIKDFIAADPRPEKSIVVLPFKNISPEEGQEYFSDGITDEIISDLSRIRAFRIISRSSAMTYKGSPKTLPEIAKELNVRYALEGSVRKAGDNLRITPSSSRPPATRICGPRDLSGVWPTSLIFKRKSRGRLSLP